MVAQFLIAFAAALAAVGLALALFRVTAPKAPTVAAASLDRQLEPIAFLFRDRVLVDATPPARSLLMAIPGEGDWNRLVAWLGMRLPDAVTALGDLPDGGRVELNGEGVGQARLKLSIEDLGDGLTRLSLADPDAENAGILVDSLSLRALEQELALLRATMDHSPMLAWRQDGDGNITWASSSYLALADEIGRGETVWPLPNLIDLKARIGKTSSAKRIQIELEGMTRWYDCHTHDIADQTIAIALPADAAVRAERSLREFVQTLTKTFADLPIGLAIFDRDRNLQLFNPALIDLTGLATGFLTARPTLYAFLDRLREARMVPEPKDYRSWRNQMNSLEAAASSGHHVEIWSLPGGQTYRVTGRPHPDGAIAFLFDDITSEISMTRKFRADLSLGAEAMDALQDAVVVFDANGEMLISNRRYGQLWDVEPRGTLDDQLQVWTKACGESPGLEALRNALHAPFADQPLQKAMAGPHGGLLSWTLRGLSGGRLLLSFAAPVPVAKPPGTVNGKEQQTAKEIMTA